MDVLWPSSCLANEMWFECLLYAKLLNSDSRPVEAAVVPQAGTVLIALGLGSYWDCSSIYNLTGILTVESRGAKAHVGQQGETVRGTWVSGFALKLHWPFFFLCVPRGLRMLAPLVLLGKPFIYLHWLNRYPLGHWAGVSGRGIKYNWNGCFQVVSNLDGEMWYPLQELQWAQLSAAAFRIGV